MHGIAVQKFYIEWDFKTFYFITFPHIRLIKSFMMNNTQLYQALKSIFFCVLVIFLSDTAKAQKSACEGIRVIEENSQKPGNSGVAVQRFYHLFSSEATSYHGVIGLVVPKSLNSIEFIRTNFINKSSAKRMDSVTEYSIQKGKNYKLTGSEKINLEISVNKPGTYTFDLLCKVNGGDKNTCATIIPVEFNIFNPSSITVSESSGVTMNSTRGFSFSGILPPRLFQRSILLSVYNSGEADVLIKDIDLNLKGADSRKELNEKHFQIERPLSLPNGKETIVSLDLRKTLDTPSSPSQSADSDSAKDKKEQAEVLKLTPDTYTGNVRLYFPDNTASIPIPVTLQVRMSAGLALLILFLGIIAGKLLKVAQAAGPQAALIPDLLRIKKVIDDLSDEDAKQTLLTRYKHINRGISEVKTKEQGQALIPRIELLERTANWLELAKDAYDIAHRRMESSAKAIELKALEDQYLEAKELILDGNWDEETQKKIESEISTLIKKGKPQPKVIDEKQGKSGTKSISPRDAERLSQIDFEALKKADATLQDLAVNIRKEVTPEPSRWDSFVASFGRFLEGILRFFTGIGSNPMVTYGIVRPIVATIILTIFLISGFNEIYINGTSTFGSEGILDWLKLFLWGFLSDVLSRGIIDAANIDKIKQTQQS